MMERDAKTVTAKEIRKVYRDLMETDLENKTDTIETPTRRRQHQFTGSNDQMKPQTRHIPSHRLAAPRVSSEPERRGVAVSDKQRTTPDRTISDNADEHEDLVNSMPRRSGRCSTSTNNEL